MARALVLVNCSNIHGETMTENAQNKKLKTVKESEPLNGGQKSPLPPGSPVFRRVRDELKTESSDSKQTDGPKRKSSKKYVNWDEKNLRKF